MRLLAHDALTVARRILVGVRAADALARNGDQAQCRALLSRLASQAEAELPVIDGVLAAQTQAAEALDLSQAPFSRWGRLPVRQQAAPHPDPANDHAATSSDTA